MKFRHLDAVELPKQSLVEQRLLRYLHRYSNGRSAQQVYGPLADTFGLSMRQRTALLQSGEESAWENRVRQARRQLVDEELLDNSQRDLWILTKTGHQAAEWLEQNGEHDPRKCGFLIEEIRW